MAFAEDFDNYFDTSDFGVTITVGGTSVVAIFDHEHVEVNGVASRRPVIQYETAAKAAAQGDAVVIASVNYVIEVIELDGTGLTSAILRTA